MNTSDFIHRFEPGRDAAAPVLLLLHGTGGNEHDLVPLGEQLAPGAPLLSPRGRVLEHGMPRFFRRFAEGVFDEEDIRRRAAELAAWLPRALREHGVAGRPVIAVGFSNGANIAASLLLLHPGALRAAVLLRGMVPLRPAMAPALGGTDVLLLSGTGDPIVPVENARELATMLRRAGATVAHEEFAAGHNLTSADLAAAKRWLVARFGAAA